MMMHEAYVIIIAIALLALLNIAMWINVDLKINHIRDMYRRTERDSEETPNM